MKAENIDNVKCTSCDACVEACVTGRIKKTEDKYHITEAPCIYCGHCIAICPSDAISSSEEHVKIEKGHEIEEDAVMSFLSSRRSTRLYKKDAIPRTVFKKLITAACYAPSGGNCQNWEFSIVTRPETLKELMVMTGEFYEGVLKFSENKTLIKLSEHTMPDKVASLKNEGIIRKIKFLIEDIKNGKDSLFYGAPCLIVVHGPKNSMTPHDNCCYALYNIVLMAHGMGIGSCINGFVTNAINGQKKIREKIGIPETNEAYGAATFGYPKYEYYKIPLRKKAKTKWF